MYKTFQYRLYPTKSQLRKLEETLESCRWVYNETLALRKNNWEEDGEETSLYDTSYHLTSWKEHNEFLYNVYANVLQNVQQRVDLAFKAFFRRVKSGEEPGYPRFKNKNRYDSFTFPKNVGFKIKSTICFSKKSGLKRVLSVSKIGDLKIKLHRRLEGQIKTLTIRKTSTGKWFASFSCELDSPLVVRPINNSIGIDLGLTTFATFSDGSSIPRQRFFKTYEKRLANASRKREALPKGSKRRNKARLVESKIHEKTANIRRNFVCKEALLLVQQYDLICFEDLNLTQMQDTNKKAIKKGIADVAWNQFIRFTQYKAENAGKRVVLVDPKNTTRECSRCGLIVPKELSERTHSCSCGLILDRDHNAAINILRRGLASFDRKV